MNTKIVIAALLPLALAQNSSTTSEKQGILDGIVSIVGNGVNQLTSHAVEIANDVANGAASAASRVESDFKAGQGKTSATPTATGSASSPHCHRPLHLALPLTQLRALPQAPPTALASSLLVLLPPLLLPPLLISS
ncbi:hypothetical protein DL89DRAFT_264914, partial [Linderina pennispora]